MEYLVTMTTHVPPGTSDEAVADVRARESEHSAGLVADGRLLRLWRPPLQPGEWRTFGLFADESDAALEQTLAGMPLRVWRTDEVTPLAPHPNDPAPARRGPRGALPEFFTTFTFRIPADAPTETVAARTAQEAARTRELADAGTLARLWMLPDAAGERRALGLWRAADAQQLQAVLDSLPVSAWLATEVVPLSPHPSDPALAAG
jgi:muconolactone delta-isomerase